MRSVNTYIVPELSEQAIIDSVKNAQETIAKNEDAEKAVSLDFYYHKNVDKHIEQWFSPQTLDQVPSFPQKIVPRFCRSRQMIYKKPPKRFIGGDISPEYSDLTYQLDIKAREASELTWLIRDIAVRSRWNEHRQRIEYDVLPFFKTYHLEGEGDSSPVGISYEIGRDKKGNRRWAFWSETRDGQQGMHYLYDQSGRVIKVNDDNRNIYDVLPFTLSHYNQGGDDVVRASIQIGVAMTEIALAERFSFGQPTITGSLDTTKVELGIDKVLQLPDDSTFSFIGNPGSLTDMIAAARSFADTVAINNSLRIRWSDSGGNPPSGEALKILELENIETRESEIPIWRQWESDRYDVDRRLIEVHTGKKLSEDYAVDFAEVGFPKSLKEKMDEWTWKFQNKLATREDYFKSENPDITDKELKERLGVIDESRQAEAEAEVPKQPTFEGLRKLGTVGS